jgi:hypothetical protein
MQCQTCEAPQLCRCLRDQFQSTTNSKRRVSTFLFWKHKLGLGFPVSDEMLRRTWKGLESCSNGIKQGNGQRKVPKGGVCVNPLHYHPNKWRLVLESLVSFPPTALVHCCSIDRPTHLLLPLSCIRAARNSF